MAYYHMFGIPLIHSLRSHAVSLTLISLTIFLKVAVNMVPNWEQTNFHTFRRMSRVTECIIVSYRVTHVNFDLPTAQELWVQIFFPYGVWLNDSHGHIRKINFEAKRYFQTLIENCRGQTFWVIDPIWPTDFESQSLTIEILSWSQRFTNEFQLNESRVLLCLALLLYVSCKVLFGLGIVFDRCGYE